MERSCICCAVLCVALLAGCLRGSSDGHSDRGLQDVDGDYQRAPVVFEDQASRDQGDSVIDPTATDASGAQAADYSLQIVSMEGVGGAQDLKLEPDYLRISIEGAEPRDVPIRGERLKHAVTLRLETDGETDEWSWNLWCCRVYSIAPGIPFSWAVWSVERMDGLRIVQDPGPAAYAAWALRRSLWFVRIDGSRSLEEALLDYFWRLREWEYGVLDEESNEFMLQMIERDLPSDPSGVVRLRLTENLVGNAFQGIGALGEDDGRIMHIDRGADGWWTVKAIPGRGRRGLPPPRVYTFVSPDGVDWKRK